MNLRGKAFVLVFGVIAAYGCGARTDTLFDDQGGLAGTLPLEIAGRSSGGSGNNAAGSPAVAGAFPSGGAVGFAGSSPTAGAFPFGGTIGVAGAPPVGGGFSTGGTFSTGGAFPFGGTFSSGGVTSTAGTTSSGGTFATGGFGAVGADAGTGGIVDLCVSTAPGACERCLCKSCATEVETCFEDIGCALIFACISSTGCSGFGCLQSCGSTISQFGGLTGPSAREALSLGTCALGSGQSCGCN